METALATTAAGTTATGTYTSDGPFTIIVDGLVGDEQIPVQCTGLSGTPAPATNGKGIIYLKATNRVVPIYTTGEIVWTFVKPVTQNAVSIGIAV